MRKPEPAISRVLSGTIIHLGQPSPTASSNLPGSPLGTGGRGAKPRCFPIWSCSRRGLPCRGLLPVARCALTAPFHPYQANLAVCFLWHFPWAHALQALPGALSDGARTFLCRKATAIAWPTPDSRTRHFSAEIDCSCSRSCPIGQDLTTCASPANWRRAPAGAGTGRYGACPSRAPQSRRPA